MKPKTLDYTVFEKFNFERKPVGIKFLLNKPAGIEKTDKSLPICRMFTEAQTGGPFYVQKEDFHCTEPLTLGMADPDPVLLSGLVGETDDLYDELRANQKIYQLVPKMLKGSVKAVVFSPINSMAYDPDVLIVTADNIDQARNIMRALVYSTGETWSSKGTPVLVCSWLYISLSKRRGQLHGNGYEHGHADFKSFTPGTDPYLDTMAEVTHDYQ